MIHIVEMQKILYGRGGPLYRRTMRSWKQHICFACGKKIRRRGLLGRGRVTSIKHYLPKSYIRIAEDTGMHLWADVVVHKECLKGRRK